MRKLPLPKVVITPEMKERQLKMRKFLRETQTEHKELKPIGFSISINTIPEGRVEEFLSIANSAKNP